VFVLFTLRQRLRREALAIAAGSADDARPGLETGTVLGAVPAFVLSLLLFTLLARLGLVATVAAVLTFSLLVMFPTTIPPAGWYAGVRFVGPALLLGLAAIAGRVATTGHVGRMSILPGFVRRVSRGQDQPRGDTTCAT
jgi:hypothetical protein